MAKAQKQTAEGPVGSDNSGERVLGSWTDVITRQAEESARKQREREEALRAMLPAAKEACTALPDEDLVTKYAEMTGKSYGFYPKEAELYKEVAEHCKGEILRRMRLGEKR